MGEKKIKQMITLFQSRKKGFHELEERKSSQFYKSSVSKLQRIRVSRHRAQGHLESSGSLLMSILFPAHQTVLVLVFRET